MNQGRVVMNIQGSCMQLGCSGHWRDGAQNLRIAKILRIYMVCRHRIAPELFSFPSISAPEEWEKQKIHKKRHLAYLRN